jgi:hypothetical protein
MRTLLMPLLVVIKNQALAVKHTRWLLAATSKPKMYWLVTIPIHLVFSKADKPASDILALSGVG